MAVRRPVYTDGNGNIRIMTEAMVNQIVSQVSYLYGSDPSVTLSVVTSGGNIGTITDRRMQAGSYTSNTTAFASEAATPNISEVSTGYDRITQSTASLSAPSTKTGTGLSMPMYVDASNNLRMFSETDFYNTFIEPAIDNLTSATISSAAAGTYHIYTSSGGYSGSSLVSGTEIFVDTRANSGAYTSAGIPETLDQPTTITSYYLYKIDASASTYTMPLCVDTSSNFRKYPPAEFHTMLQNYVKYAAVNRTNYKIRYTYYGTGVGSDVGVTRGSSMVDTKLNGSSASGYTQLFVNDNDYRTQEFPNGTSTDAASYVLRIYKAT